MEEFGKYRHIIDEICGGKKAVFIVPKIIPILIYWAKMGEANHTYSDLTQELGYDKFTGIGNQLGYVADVIHRLHENTKKNIPTLNGLIRSKNSNLPSSGFSYVHESFNKLSESEKQRIVKSKNEEAIQYGGWNWVLDMLGLNSWQGEMTSFFPDTIDENTKFSEGLAARVLVNRYERSVEARRKCIDAKGYKFLQQNSPGNDGYGQKGIKGDTGDSGNSVYFTPYILSKDSQKAICEQLIIEGKELSDNPEYAAKNIEYKVNDLILDKLGDVYMLKTWREEDFYEGESPYNIAYLNNIFSVGSITGSSLNCVLNINFSEPEYEYYYKKYNDSFIGPYNNKSSSPYIYHRDRYKSRICGGWLSFAIPTSIQDYQNYLYKYVLMLPNGQRIEKISNTSSCEMFVDNRYFYSCRFSSEVNNELSELANYHSINNTGEYEPDFTRKLLTEAMPLCTAYVEITNRDSRKIYRIYADSISLEGVEGYEPEES